MLRDENRILHLHRDVQLGSKSKEESMLPSWGKHWPQGVEFPSEEGWFSEGFSGKPEAGTREETKEIHALPKKGAFVPGGQCLPHDGRYFLLRKRHPSWSHELKLNKILMKMSQNSYSQCTRILLIPEIHLPQQRRKRPPNLLELPFP